MSALSNIYPNPAKSIVNVILYAPASLNANVLITDPAGKPVMRQSTQLAGGSNNLSLDINKLPSGTYLFKAVFVDGGQIKVSKFVKY